MEQEAAQNPASPKELAMPPPTNNFLMPVKVKKDSAVKEKKEVLKLENKWSIIDIDLAVAKPPTEIEEFSKLKVYSLPELK